MRAAKRGSGRGKTERLRISWHTLLAERHDTPAAETKKPAEAGSFSDKRSVVAHDAHQLQQADEQVVQRNVQADGGHDVVALAAMDDGAGLVEDADRGEQYETGADRQLQTADLEEEACDHGAQQDEETGSDEAAEEAHVLAGDQHE